MSSPQPTIPPDVLDAIFDTQIDAYFNVAAVALYIYDYVLTFAAEVNFIWLKPFSIVSVLFYITRYLPFYDTVALFFYSVIFHPSSPHAFIKLYKMQVWSYAIGITFAEGILLLRTTAIWGNDKKIAILLSTLLFGITGPSYYLVWKYIHDYEFQLTVNQSNAVVNLPTHVDTTILIPYALWLAFETLMLLLVLAKFGQNQRSSLYREIFKVGVQFYFYLFVLSVINIILMAAAPPALATALLTSVHRVLHAIFACRIVLNIRMSSIQSRTSRITPSLGPSARETFELTSCEQNMSQIEFVSPSSCDDSTRSCGSMTETAISGQGGSSVTAAEHLV